MSELYTSHATANNGRDGDVRTADGVLNIKLSRPRALGDAEQANTSNPEQLFAMAYATCFGSAIKEIAEQRQQIILEPEVNAHVTLHKTETDGFHLSVKLNVKIPNLAKLATTELVHAAQQICPYSKAVRNNIRVIFE